MIFFFLESVIVLLKHNRLTNPISPLCEDHWVASFLLRKAVTIREAREAPSGTSLVTRTIKYIRSMDTTSVMSGVIGQAAGSPGPSSSFRSVTSAMSMTFYKNSDSVAQNTSGGSHIHNSHNHNNHPCQDSVPTSPRQQPSSLSSSSHQPLEGMFDPRMPSLHATFNTNHDNSTSRFRQNTFEDRGVFIPSTRSNSALSPSSSSTTEQRAGLIHTSPTLIVELYKTGSPLFRRPRGLVTSDLDNACKKAQLLNK
ncbi:hypothetical protein BDC45DRAFT_542628 [Circinella umbellata]|nr:hypothetical protein BDC45DRAFT_542628 [Circinella umbellata]